MKQYTVTGMSCAACSTRVEKGGFKVPGVTSCSVSLFNQLHGRGRKCHRPGDHKSSSRCRLWRVCKTCRREKNGGANSAAASEEALADHETPILKKRLLYSAGFYLSLCISPWDI